LSFSLVTFRVRWIKKKDKEKEKEVLKKIKDYPQKFMLQCTQNKNMY